MSRKRINLRIPSNAHFRLYRHCHVTQKDPSLTLAALILEHLPRWELAPGPPGDDDPDVHGDKPAQQPWFAPIYRMRELDERGTICRPASRDILD
jgi:hypothetical protein